MRRAPHLKPPRGGVPERSGLFLRFQEFNEMLILGFFLFNGALAAGAPPEGVGNPENVTVHVIDSNTVEVSWSTTWKNVERYDVTYNPTENRVVSQAAGDGHSIILRELRPNTQYQVTVTAVVGGKNYRSRRLVFRTSGAEAGDALDAGGVGPLPTKPPKARKTLPTTPETINPDPTAVGSKYTPQTSTTVRGVEIGLVLLALVVWIIAIALFFHRWGKIRMLLPYQPDYKTQQSLKVPGTGTTIVSGCAGNGATQGQQEGPGCVQHLRWSSRHQEEASTARKSSPARRALKPRVSSAIFPASPPFLYARTSAECESPRRIRRARSHGEFPPETIPLCQVNRPRSESPEDVISIAVPVASDADDRPRPGKPEEERRTNIGGGESPEGGEAPSALGRPRGHFQGGKPPEVREPEPLFFVESEEPRFRGPPAREPRPPRPEEKPRRYNRSSLRKQKIRLCDDRDLGPCNDVPIYEFEGDLREGGRKEQEADGERNRKPKDLKTAEMRRKTFLRKISLQDTYLNYNQDYWLDFKKSLRFHKSIDLGCFDDEKGSGRGGKRTPDDRPPEDSIWEEPFALRERPPPSATFPLDPTTRDFRRSDSDPIIFPSSECSCDGCGGGGDSRGFLAEVAAACGRREPGARGGWLLLPSDENIPLFSERNGLIETDFEVLNAFDEEILSGRRRGSEPPGDPDAPDAPLDYSRFYEIRLSDSNEDLPRSPEFHFQGGEAFLDLSSLSGDSEVFLHETAPLRVPDDRGGDFPPLARSPSSPPKSSYPD